MKLFTNKSVVLKIVIALVIVLIFNFIMSKPSYGFDGGKLFEPILQLFVGVGDMMMGLIHEVVFGIQDSLWEIDRGADTWNFLPWVAAIGYVGVSVLLAVVTGGASIVPSIIIGIKTATVSIGGATVAYFVTSVVTEAILPETYYLALYSITPEEIFANKIALLDINFINPTSVSDFAIKGGGHAASVLSPIISGWYSILRNIAIIGLLCVLVYIGIRIIISSTAPEKSKYKGMIKDWLIAMCLLFFLHYIMLFSVTAVNKITDIVSGTLDDYGVETIKINDQATYEYVKNKGEDIQNTEGLSKNPLEYMLSTNDPEDGSGYWVYWTADNFMAQARMKLQNLDENGDPALVSCGWIVIFLVMVLYTIYFLFTYLKRLLYLAFLTLVAPLVALTYPIDKINDGKSQAFDMWFKEYIFNLLLQPFHLVLYTVLIGSAMELASNNPLYAVVAIGFMMPAERLMRKMFGFEKAQTPGFLGGAVGAGIMMSGVNKLLHHPHKKSSGSDDSSNGGNQDKLRTQDVANTPSIDNEEEPAKLNTNTQDFNDSWQNEISDEEKQQYLHHEMFRDDLRDNAKQFETDEEKQFYNDQADYHQKEMDKIREKYQSQQQSQTQQKRQFDDNSNNRNIRRGLGRVARRYARLKGDKIRARANVEPKKILRTAAGLAGATVAGTAGAVIGLSSGDPSKMATMTAGAAAGGYAFTKGSLPEREVKGNLESFKRGYLGEEEYRKRQKEKATKEFINSTEVKERLENNFTYEEAKHIRKNVISEYRANDIKDIEQIMAGYQLEKSGQSRKVAMTTTKYAENMGDASKMTKKKKDEWKKTLISKGYNDKTANAMINNTIRYHQNKGSLK